jgi:hypothetical protein
MCESMARCKLLHVVLTGVIMLALFSNVYYVNAEHGMTCKNRIALHAPIQICGNEYFTPRTG